MKISISISRTGKLPREISIRVEYSFGEMGRGGLTVNHADVRAPVTGYRTGLVRITLGNERLVEWIGSFHEASSNFVSIGRARSTASIRRLFFYEAFTILRMAPVMPSRQRGSPGPTSCESHNVETRKVPLSLSTSSLSSSLSNPSPTFLLFSKDLERSDPLFLWTMELMDGWMDGWMDYRANLNKAEGKYVEDT